MRVGEMMTKSPATCEPSTSLRLVAQLMTDHDCAAIPVTQSGRVVGIITDRDIACRAVAMRMDAPRLRAEACMSAPVIVVSTEDSLERAAVLMAENAIHHLPVIAPDGTLAGMIAQSDLGRRMTNREFGQLVRSTSIRMKPGYRYSEALMRQSH